MGRNGEGRGGEDAILRGDENAAIRGKQDLVFGCECKSESQLRDTREEKILGG